MLLKLASVRNLGSLKPLSSMHQQDGSNNLVIQMWTSAAFLGSLLKTMPTIYLHTARTWHASERIDAMLHFIAVALKDILPSICGAFSVFPPCTWRGYKIGYRFRRLVFTTARYTRTSRTCYLYSFSRGVPCSWARLCLYFVLSRC